MANMNKKKIMLMAGAYVLVAALAVTGTIAYLTSQDEDVNVMTLGNIKIEQIEQQWNDDLSALEDFEQAKPLYPYVGALNLDKTDINDGAYRRYTMNNVVDKYVSVKNTGLSDAYIRTVFAFEMGDNEQQYNNVKTSLNAIADQDYAYADTWQWTEDFTAAIDGKNYNIKVAVHKAEVKPNETTIPSLLQVYLDKTATNETIESIDGNKNGTYDILVLSQAVQTKGFDNAVDALNEAFGQATQENVEAWFTRNVQDIPKVLDSYDAIKAVKNNDGTYVLSEDFEVDNVIFFGNGTNVSLDLNGKTITDTNTNQYALGAQDGAKLHLNGDGVVDMGKGFMANKGNAEIVVDGGTYHSTVSGSVNVGAFASIAQNNAKIIINGGTFTTNVDNSALFLATSNGIIEVNGGFFENTVDKTPDLFNLGTNKGNTNRVILKGGTFVNWNPMEDRMMYKGQWPNSYDQFSGPWMLVWDGYKVVSETQANGDVWYSVVPE